MEMVGKASEFGQAQTLPVPPFAYRAFSGQPLNALDMYASGRMIAFGMAGAQGKRIMPWRKNRMGRGAQQAAQGLGMLYSPLGKGVAQ